MSRLGPGIISSDDTATPAALPAAPSILSAAQGGTGNDTSSTSGIPEIRSGTWVFTSTPNTVNVFSFLTAAQQADVTAGTGLVDCSAGIQAAIDYLGTTGGTVYFPPGTYLILSTLTIGDGTGASPLSSTINGIRLVGSSSSAYPLGVVRILWGGAGSGIMMTVAGAIEGIDIKNLEFDGQNLAGYCLQLTKVHSGELTGLQFWRYLGAGLTLNDCTAIIGENIVCWNPAVASVAGLICEGSADGSESTCFCTFTNLIIYLDTTGVEATYGVVLRVADAVHFQNMLVYGESDVVSSCAVLFDYTVNTTFPSQCTFDACDVGWEIPTATAWQNTGTPASTARPNTISALCEVNGGILPRGLANVEFEPKLRSERVALVAASGAKSATTIITPAAGDVWRASYYLTMTVAGTGGTISATILWNDGVGANWATSSTVDATATGTTGTAQGCFVFVNAAAQAIQYQTNFSNVTGSPTYSLYVHLERL